ncbi:substrate-binding periplasmic protein [Shewanella colwelliana]|uniref:substrate-binding periplasmic protein n=1 Tax=Shewanella colwelliana TaxID=23 RepID=UPI0022AE9CD4|nr:ABC transporter substrate-binding protein [Shewanella colwelliana]MCZ4338642.1 ABC transporter substrate-binding protein [Shewanella colwelliana]
MFGTRPIVTALLCFTLTNFAVLAEPVKVLTYDVAPFAFTNDEQNQGLLIEVLDELFKRSRLEYQVQFLPLKRAIISVEHDNNACVLPIERSQEREVHFQWISPVLVSRYGLFGLPESQIHLTTLEDAKPYVIGSFLGSGVGEYLKDFGFRVELTTSNRQNVNKLLRKRIPFWAAELVSANHLMKKARVNLTPELVFYTSLRAMACNKEMDVNKTESLQASLLSMYHDGFLTTLYAKYGTEI